MKPNGLEVVAVYVVLNDEPFIEASLESVYPFASRIYVLTALDRTWDGTRIDHDDTLNKVLTFPDPDNKLTVVRAWSPDEAVARNWVMAMELAKRAAATKVKPAVVGPEVVKEWSSAPDFFWIVDGDEIYDPATVPAIFSYLRHTRASWIKVWAHIYFKTWNYRVNRLESFTAFLRPGRCLHHARNPRVGRLMGVVSRLGKLGQRVFETALRMDTVPPEVGVFHHPAYVGPTERITSKVAHTPHRAQVLSDWLEEVWERWHPGMKNFHPTHPEEFPAAEYVPDSDLPEIIRKRDWPPGYFGEVARP